MEITKQSNGLYSIYNNESLIAEDLTKDARKAITALLNGEYDNKKLLEVGFLFVDVLSNIKSIVSYYGGTYKAN